MKPTLLYYAALPGAGKTRLSERLAIDLDMDHYNSDQLRYQMFPEPTYDLHSETIPMFNRMQELTKTALAAGRSAIYDAYMHSTGLRLQLVDLAEQAGGVALCVHIDTDPELCRQRVAERKVSPDYLYTEDITLEIFDRVIADDEPPTDHRENVVVINPSLGHEDSLEIIRAGIVAIQAA
ncbi:MAG: ATP-binding protein [Patescibacteria group bacterium]